MIDLELALRVIRDAEEAKAKITFIRRDVFENNRDKIDNVFSVDAKYAWIAVDSAYIDFLKERYMKILRLGDKGIEVEEIQKLLSSKGFKCVIDGDFGPNTERQVRAFQTRILGADQADGVVGPVTYAALNGVTPKPDPAKKYSGVLSFAKGSDIQLSKNFHLSEWQCLCGHCSRTTVDFNHVEKLQLLRDSLGRSISINSAYRCPAHNSEVGGVVNSEHVMGCATDIDVEGMSPAQVQSKCENFDGLGYYSSFTHVDSRGYTARWNG